ncbi:MAG TPA: hypothetical protein VJU54_01000 [Nitrospiraceae bacterium]|nr:hypothetical protein [Nitrospiraceae bacterium]
MNAGLESSGDAFQYRDLFVKAEVYWVLEDRQDVILKEVGGVV